MASLSVIVITKNEEHAIVRCLESVRFADEVIVVDSGSTDQTVALCRDRGAKVTVTPDWPGFGPQKNRALELATGEWVLSIDADEWVSDELAGSIQRAVRNSSPVSGYELQRLSSFCGRFLRHSGWWPDPVLRLFKRDKARFSDDLVHERVLLDGRMSQLDGLLFHDSLRSLEEVLEKMNRYSTAGAETLAIGGERNLLSIAVLRGAWTFVRSYVIRGGFLDGPEGLMQAISGAEGVYYKYAKLWLMNRNRARRPPTSS